MLFRWWGGGSSGDRASTILAHQPKTYSQALVSRPGRPASSFAAPAPAVLEGSA